MMNNDDPPVTSSSSDDAWRLRRRRRCDELDVVPMDRALLTMLLPRVQSMFQYVAKPHVLLQEDWILCGMHLLSYYFSVHQMTPAMKALQLKLNGARNYRQILCLIVSIVGPTLYSTLYRHTSTIINATSNNNNSSHHDMTRINTHRSANSNLVLARQRQQWLWKEIIKWISRIISPLRLWSFLNFLKSTHSSSPLSLAWRLGGLQYTPSSNDINHPQQHITLNFLYAYRRYMYEEGLELAYAMLPISRMGILPSALVAFLTRIKTRVRKIVLKYISTTSANGALNNSNDDNNNNNNENNNITLRCSHCGDSPISIPYQIYPCRHVYCYTCLRQAFIDNPNHRCEECGHSIQSSQRL